MGTPDPYGLVMFASTCEDRSTGGPDLGAVTEKDPYVKLLGRRDWMTWMELVLPTT